MRKVFFILFGAGSFALALHMVLQVHKLSMPLQTKFIIQDAGSVDRVTVIRVDEVSIKNAIITDTAATAQIVGVSPISLHAEPLFSTIDRRPITVRRQFAHDKRHRNGTLLGCAFNTNTVVSHLHWTDSTKFISEYSRCTLCVDFLDPVEANSFAKNVAIIHLLTACVDGRVRVNAQHIGWEKRRTKNVPTKHGFPYSVDCELPNGYPDLTCRHLSNLHKERVYVKTQFMLFVQDTKNFITSSWPWSALQTMDTDSQWIAAAIKSWHVPKEGKGIQLAFVEGPSFHRKVVQGMEIIDTATDSTGGMNSRLQFALHYQLQHAPNSVRILGVLMQQFESTQRNLNKMLETKFFGAKTLKSAMVERNVSIVLVAISVPPISFYLTIQAAQDAFGNFIAARFASDYQVMISMDGDAILGIGPQYKNFTVQELLYHPLFDGISCHSAYFKLAEMHLHSMNNSTPQKITQCIEYISSSTSNWLMYASLCEKAYGNIVARSDSIQSFDIHSVTTDPSHLPENVRACNGRHFQISPEKILELHLTPKNRSAECTCTVNL